jgi:hypothetical protein
MACFYWLGAANGRAGISALSAGARASGILILAGAALWVIAGWNIVVGAVFSAVYILGWFRSRRRAAPVSGARQRASRLHTGEEFGKSPVSGNPLAGLDGPMIGASNLIMVDAMTERESGVTPPPPPISTRALAIALVVMFLIGLLIVYVALTFLHIPLVAPQ